MQSTALFTNFSKEEFEGFWNGKGRKFQPGQSMHMPDYLAKHFAKHLTNRELIRKDDKGSLIYSEGEKMTSPKRPEDVPLFMDLFNKAYTPETEDIGEEGDDVDALIASANANRAEGEDVSMNAEPPKTLTPAEKGKITKAKNKAIADAKQDPSGPQVITPPDFDDE